MRLDAEADDVGNASPGSWIVAVGPAAALGVLALAAMSGLSQGPPGPDGAPAWARRLDAQIARGAYGWARIDYVRPVAVLAGEAATAQLRDAAVAALEHGIRRDSEAAADVGLVVDAISVRGGPAAVGGPLLGLSGDPDVPACQLAFDETLSGRSIGFGTGMADLSGGSDRLLDALAGVSMRCAAHAITIEAHTDVRGASEDNLELSRRRAETVRTALIARGAPAAALGAVGYGETRPLDRRAHTRNRRIAFTVSRGASDG